MNTETEVLPDAETQTQATENPETPETPEAPEAETEAKAQPESKDEDRALERMNRRIAKRTADFYRERARADQLAGELERLRAVGGDESPEAKPEVDIHRLAKEEASVMRFTERANQIVAQGEKKDPAFMEVMRDLASEVGEFVDRRTGKPSAFMEVVIEVADNPTELLYHLGKNPDIASELADLSPIRLAKRLDRIEREMSESSKPKPSAAPKPLEPVKSTAPPSTLPDDKDSTDDWIKKERARMASKGINRYG